MFEEVPLPEKYHDLFEDTRGATALEVISTTYAHMRGFMKGFRLSSGIPLRMYCKHGTGQGDTWLGFIQLCSSDASYVESVREMLMEYRMGCKRDVDVQITTLLHQTNGYSLYVSVSTYY